MLSFPAKKIVPNEFFQINSLTQVMLLRVPIFSRSIYRRSKNVIFEVMYLCKAPYSITLVRLHLKVAKKETKLS